MAKEGVWEDGVLYVEQNNLKFKIYAITKHFCNTVGSCAWGSVWVAHLHCLFHWLWYIVPFQRFCSYLDLKSKQPDANVPPLERSLRRITEPDPDVIGQQTQLIQNLGKAFELKENPKVRCKYLLYWLNLVQFYKRKKCIIDYRKRKHEQRTYWHIVVQVIKLNL